MHVFSDLSLVNADSPCIHLIASCALLLPFLPQGLTLILCNQELSAFTLANEDLLVPPSPCLASPWYISACFLVHV